MSNVTVFSCVNLNLNLAFDEHLDEGIIRVLIGIQSWQIRQCHALFVHPFALHSSD